MDLFMAPPTKTPGIVRDLLLDMVNELEVTVELEGQHPPQLLLLLLSQRVMTLLLWRFKLI